MDRRQQKTRSAIFSAFIDLLSKKSYSKITVQEIIDTANVGRTTFYAHFETKDDLLKEVCTSLFDHVFSDVPQIESTHDFSAARNKTDAIITHILYHLRDNHRNILDILTCDSGDLFLKFFKHYLNDLVSQHMVLKIPLEIPKELLINHISGSFVNLVQWWIEGGLKQSPEQITVYFKTVIMPIFD
ncbi:TetR/AcrR family transcriptional regulator [bacterium 1xD8-6]|nr:TetR/AcrR family transcriptional regulator [bacterium D16-36]RKI73606.1 TetR/AcrR family transcriptional regulator [bacterium 1xD8-6]